MITSGVTGGRWRAAISPYGAIAPTDGPTLDWHIAADDRWHSPEQEATVRQRRIDGTAVVETRVRIPDGDAVQRVYSVADHGGMTVIEVENESPLPIAIAFTNGKLLSLRPPSAPIQGIDLPAESVAFPVGHRATLRVAIPHGAHGAGELPGGLPTAEAVARGWVTTVERAGRLLLPDTELNERIVATRCELALGGPPPLHDDPLGYLLAVDQLVRMGEQAEPFVPPLVAAVELAAKSAARDWVLAAALNAVDRVLAIAGEVRARRDLAALRERLAPSDQLPKTAPTDPLLGLVWIERRIVSPRQGEARLLPDGLPPTWLGHNFEVFGVPATASGTVAYAVRWHGDRPAVLWEQSPGPDGPAHARCARDSSRSWSGGPGPAPPVPR